MSQKLVCFFFPQGNNILLNVAIEQNLFWATITNDLLYVHAYWEKMEASICLYFLQVFTKIYIELPLSVMCYICTCLPTVQPKTDFTHELSIRKENEIKV